LAETDANTTSGTEQGGASSSPDETRDGSSIESQGGAPAINTPAVIADSGSSNADSGTSNAGSTSDLGTGFATGGSEAPPDMGGSGGIENIPDAGGTGNNQPPPNMGNEDGDPNRPMVEIPGVPCGTQSLGMFGFGATFATVQITGRDVVLSYPCAHEGADVTFFLFLHGTVDGDMKVPFTMNAFRIHEFVDSHNIIVAVPTAITSQWGNGDNGQDLPHLYDVVDWVYDTFGSKFNIRSWWTQGGSWGAAYLGFVFACDPRFEGRLTGVQMVVGGGCPLCSGRLSCIVAQEELEKGGGSPVSDAQKEALSSGASIDPYATQHGCGGKTGPEDVGNAKHWSWPNCDPGWVYSYYLGPGNHADAWDIAVVEKIANQMKSIE